jgi:hypothetical protein
MERRAYLLAILAAWPLFTGALGERASADTVEPGKEGELAQILQPVPGQKICFARDYDAAHLKSHPAQKVTNLLFELHYHTFEPDQYFPQGQRNYYFTLAAKVRDVKEALYSSGECSPWDTGIFCGVDCDGGGITLSSQPDGSIRIGFDPEIPRLRMTIGCGEDETGQTYELTPGADDKEFRLERVDLSACKTLDEK